MQDYEQASAKASINKVSIKCVFTCVFMGVGRSYSWNVKDFNPIKLFSLFSYIMLLHHKSQGHIDVHKYCVKSVSVSSVLRFIFYGITEQVNRPSFGSFSKTTFELAEGLEQGSACMCLCRTSLCTKAVPPFFHKNIHIFLHTISYMMPCTKNWKNIREKAVNMMWQ